jgi:hypothetical protein
MVERARTKSTPGRECLKKMAKESISRFVLPEESAVAPSKVQIPSPVAFATNDGI